MSIEESPASTKARKKKQTQIFKKPSNSTPA